MSLEVLTQRAEGLQIDTGYVDEVLSTHLGCLPAPCNYLFVSWHESRVGTLPLQTAVCTNAAGEHFVQLSVAEEDRPEEETAAARFRDAEEQEDFVFRAGSCDSPACPLMGEWAGRLRTLRCTRCQAARYCTRGCQRQHWRAHKAACTATAAQRLSGRPPSGLRNLGSTGYINAALQLMFATAPIREAVSACRSGDPDLTELRRVQRAAAGAQATSARPLLRVVSSEACLQVRFCCDGVRRAPG